MRKRRAIEHRYFEAETSVGDADDISVYEDLKMSAEPKDKIEMENLIYSLTAEESAVLLLKHIGYKPTEIYKIMGFKTMKRYRGVYHDLKRHVYLFRKLNCLTNGKNY
jgi:DNA-directed RNA polymerase specialized sigma24 family protein